MKRQHEGQLAMFEMAEHSLPQPELVHDGHRLTKHVRRINGVPCDAWTFVHEGRSVEIVERRSRMEAPAGMVKGKPVMVELPPTYEARIDGRPLPERHLSFSAAMLMAVLDIDGPVKP